MLGGSLCLTGLVFNTILLYIFLCRLGVRGNNVYLAILCVSDLWLMIAYICAFPIGIGAEYYHILWLHNLWHLYIRYVFTMTQAYFLFALFILDQIIQVAQTTASYILVAACLERYWQVGKKSLEKKMHKQQAVFTGVCANALLSSAGFQLQKQTKTKPIMSNWAQGSHDWCCRAYWHCF